MYGNCVDTGRHSSRIVCIMGRAVDHIGEMKTMNCGEVVTIIGKTEKQNYYKMRTSDGFEFEGEYRNFKNGTIDPNQYKSHIGEIKTMNCGEDITIIGKAKKDNYYKMRTSDGFEFEGEYRSFKNGTIDPNQYKSHIGEIKTMNCGEIITIIGKVQKNNYYKMRTSDGFEFEGDYKGFKKGTINPDFYKDHIGETRTMNYGEVVTIIDKAEKKNYYKMRTSDGFEFEGSYQNFKKRVINPDRYKDHIGETKTMNCGEVVTIIDKAEKLNYYKMRTSDGFEFEGSYQNFKKGTMNPDLYKDHIGETKAMNCGEVVTIIEKTEKHHYYRMRTSDGFEFEGEYKSFKKGTIDPRQYKDHIGETKIMNCGLSAKCVKYNKCTDLTIEYEDGYMKEHVSYCSFNKRTIVHPDLNIKNNKRNFHGYWTIGDFINNDGRVYYNAIRLSDWERVFLTPQQMIANEVRIIDEIPVLNSKREPIGTCSKRVAEKLLEKDVACTFRDTPNAVIIKNHPLLGETSVMACGLSATCIGYNKNNNFTVEFEDGCILEHITKSAFENITIVHPELDPANPDRNFHGYQIDGKGINKEYGVYYNAIRLSDGEKVYMTPQMMMAAEKTANEV